MHRLQMAALESTGNAELKAAALGHAARLLRTATGGGEYKALKSHVVEAAHQHSQVGGRTVLPMEYFKGQEGGGAGAVTLPLEYFGRPPLQRGGAWDLKAEELKAVAAAEGMIYTPFALTQVRRSVNQWLNSVYAVLRATYPRTKSYTGKHVKQVLKTRRKL